MKIFYKLSLLFFLTLFCVSGMAQAPYCTISSSYGCSDDDGLTSFHLSTMYQVIGCDGSPDSYYNDYTATPIPLVINTPYTITVTVGYSSGHVSIYCDLNNDNEFTGTDILVADLLCPLAGVNYTTTITIPTGTSYGTHRLRARGVYNSAPSDPCGAFSFGNYSDYTINLIAPGPCIPAYSTGCANGDGLTSFKLNTIDQAIPCTGTPSYYHDFTGVTTNITENLPYTVTVQAGYPGTIVKVWCDLNNNDVFEQPGDILISSINCALAGTSYTGTLTIPSGTSLGNHRLRYRTSRASAPGDPCAALSYGNAADFTINVQTECTPTYTTGCISGDGLTLFQLNSINQPMVCDGVPDNYYSNLLGISTDVVINQPTTMTFQAGSAYTFVTVWVDLNNNHIFEPSEIMVPGMQVPLANTSFSTTFTIPPGTSMGIHRMRVRTNWLSASGDPCSNLSYGNSADFSIVVVQPSPPIIATIAATAVSPSGGTVNGTVNAKGSNTAVTFEYGLTNAYGNSVAAVPVMVSGTTSTAVHAVLTGLLANETYHYRVFGTNVAGTTYGSDMTFVTCPAGPAGTITGPTLVCPGSEGYVYSVEPIMNATGYTWSLPPGAIITGQGEGGNSITVAYTNTGFSGNVSVFGFSECGSGTPSQLAVNVFIPPDPSVNGTEVVCANDAPSVYTTQSGMTAYEWWVSPNGMITEGGGSTDTSVTVLWYSNGAGSVKVNYNNGTVCASVYQPYHQVVINYQPIPAITGQVVTCIGMTGNVYSTDPGMTSYTWELSAGAIITAGGGANDNTITVIWGTAGMQNVKVNYSGPNGCRASDPTVFQVIVNPEVAPTFSGPAVAETGGFGSAYFTEANFSNYSWTVSPGGTISAGGTSETNDIVVIWNTPGPNWVSVNYSNGTCTQASATVFDVVVGSPSPVAGVAGTVSYANQSSTPMTNTTVKLRGQNGIVAQTTVTDNSGAYAFDNVQPGFYTVEGQTTKKWGGANSTDALLVMKHFTMMNTISGISLSAADVNASSTVNSIDALMIAKRYVNLVSSFAAGDWVFEITPVVVSNSIVTHDMKARCYGDLNGSYSPPAVKLPATTSLQQSGTQEISSMMSFAVPFRLANNTSVGAVSLVLNYPAEYFSVEGVEMDNAGELAYTANNGELRISWYSLSGLNVAENPLLILKLRSKDISHATPNALAFSLDGSSELSDPNAIVIQDANINYPKLAVSANAAGLNNYPNPFNGTTTINYNVPVDGNVSLVLYNLLGEEVSVLINNVYTTASSHQITLSSNNLEAGVYVCKLYVADMVYARRITVIK